MHCSMQYAVSLSLLRASISATHFERLVFLKGNMDLIGFKKEEEGEQSNFTARSEEQNNSGNARH